MGNAGHAAHHESAESPRLQRDAALPDRLLDRRGGRDGHRDRSGPWQREHVALSVVLAFVFGYLLTMLPLLRAGVALRTALGLAFASDTASIAIMEIVDNAIVLAIPGAMDAGLGEPLFWGSLALSLLVAGAGGVSRRSLADRARARPCGRAPIPRRRRRAHSSHH